jgi:hypothetical protein
VPPAKRVRKTDLELLRESQGTSPGTTSPTTTTTPRSPPPGDWDQLTTGTGSPPPPPPQTIKLIYKSTAPPQPPPETPTKTTPPPPKLDLSPPSPPPLSKDNNDDSEDSDEYTYRVFSMNREQFDDIGSQILKQISSWYNVTPDAGIDKETWDLIDKETEWSGPNSVAIVDASRFISDYEYMYIEYKYK